ncbi:MAG: patatin-like phospholipase family protein, partial [Gemmatimonadota bacterium]|nr:patatin-like phospholipase family protein [Gemmatimonadota bacterium]
AGAGRAPRRRGPGARVVTSPQPLGPYGIVFSGGGALGAWEVGCLERLVAHHGGAYPSVVTGASAGAINAAGVALGMTAADLRLAWAEMRPEDVFRPNPRDNSWRRIIAHLALDVIARRYVTGSVLRAVRGLRSVFDVTPLDATFDRLMARRWDAFTRFAGKLAIGVTSLGTNAGKYYYAPELALTPTARWRPIVNFAMLKDALLASAAIPIAFEPRNDEVDGGVLHNQPLAAADHLLAAGLPIYVLIPQVDRLPQSLDLAVLPGRLLSTWMSQGFKYELSRMAVRNIAAVPLGERPRPVCLVRSGIDLESLGSGLLKFGAAVEAIVDRGRRDADNALATFRATDERTWPVELRAAPAVYP